MNFESAKKLLTNRRDPSRKKIAPNTWLLHDLPKPGEVIPSNHPWNQERMRVRFHNTCILTFFQDGHYIINFDGFQTRTTFDRLRWLMPDGCSLRVEHVIRTRRGVKRNTILLGVPGPYCWRPFQDGAVWRPDHVHEEMPPVLCSENAMHILSQIRAYVKDFRAALSRGEPITAGEQCCAVALKEGAFATHFLKGHLPKRQFMGWLLQEAARGSGSSVVRASALFMEENWWMWKRPRNLTERVRFMEEALCRPRIGSTSPRPYLGELEIALTDFLLEEVGFYLYSP